MAVDVQARRRLTAALLGREAPPEPDAAADPVERVTRGVLLDIGPHMLSMATPKGEERFVFADSTTFWHGREVCHTDLRPGQDVVVRSHPANRWVVERLWADLARVTGVIAERTEDTLVVDTGHDRPRVTATVPYRASGRMGVRHPRLEPGYLFDAVGIWRDGEVQALIPVTSQPDYPVSRIPARPPVERYRETVSGTATWYDPALGKNTHVNPLATAVGAAYPALDGELDCGPDCDRHTTCAALPLLSIGARLRLRNDCTGRSAVVPVTACASATSRFCDRCRACASEGRGRIAQLTLLSFIGLGGSPEAGCFNATLTVG
ncbi:hypothetical protein [Marinitenerispora sediminis]|uniref:Uncharacterized protein n=1 Tax=Marinitenerispora sediminis TaxID=1931232 RepID=A0A368T7Y5_9ACTN|nr:hypothetical protein [Marinitenerispora sediminis]RCV51348.1 hypothetical protein DEF28_15605 [Marinitenerispora sediminis]RCV57176.1 hypothetical protein DEF23_11180 [Marinitenerispora sediminis]RCV60317.1 hypothetical protein DEF24_07520 [Marinitenerispora sediminis]